MLYKIKIKPEVHQDIQENIDWYNLRQKGLGKRFHTVVKLEFKNLRQNPFFQIRYSNIRCLPLKKFPYMIHYIVEEDIKLIVILGVISTYKDPMKWPGIK